MYQNQMLIEPFGLLSSGIPYLLARCEEIRHCFRRRPDHIGGHLQLLGDQCVRLLVAADSFRHRGLQNLQISHTGRAKDKRGTPLQVS